MFRSPSALRSFALAVMALPLLAATGCNTSSRPAGSADNDAGVERAVPAKMAIPGLTRANSAMESLRNLREALVTEKTQTDRVLAAMAEVMNSQGDLVPSFRNFTASLVDLRTAHQRVQVRMEEMRSGARDYITGWEVEVYGVEDPELRKQAENRRNQVRGNYGRINESLKTARGSYATFETTASGVQTALANDLTKAGVAAVSATAKKTGDAGTAHKQQLDAAVAELDRVMGEMTPTGPAVAPTASR
jgi:hypothetical protein